jgi:hypothetical protein
VPPPSNPNSQAKKNLTKQTSRLLAKEQQPAALTFPTLPCPAAPSSSSRFSRGKRYIYFFWFYEQKTTARSSARHLVRTGQFVPLQGQRRKEESQLSPSAASGGARRQNPKGIFQQNLIPRNEAQTGHGTGIRNKKNGTAGTCPAYTDRPCLAVRLVGLQRHLRKDSHILYIITATSQLLDPYPSAPSADEVEDKARGLSRLCIFWGNKSPLQRNLQLQEGRIRPSQHTAHRPL